MYYPHTTPDLPTPPPLPETLLQMRIDDFTVEADPNALPGGTHAFIVRGPAIERFTQMTNWDYYEAVKR
jgi:hypothetical protein